MAPEPRPQVRRIPFGVESLDELLANDLELSHELPADVEVHNMFIDDRRQTLELIVFSEEFSAVPEGHEIPSVSHAVIVGTDHVPIPDDPYENPED